MVRNGSKIFQLKAEAAEGSKVKDLMANQKEEVKVNLQATRLKTADGKFFILLIFHGTGEWKHLIRVHPCHPGNL